MLKLIRKHLSLRTMLQQNIRVRPHSHPNVFVVYTLTDKGPWNRIYTGPLTDDMAVRLGWAVRETPWVAFKRILRTIKATAVGLVR